MLMNSRVALYFTAQKMLLFKVARDFASISAFHLAPDCAPVAAAMANVSRRRKYSLMTRAKNLRDSGVNTVSYELLND